MSKSKSKTAPKASKSDILTKVKGAAVAKPAQSVKAKNKEIAKKVAAKEDKKDKKNKKVPVKEPTPEPDSEEEEDSDDSSEGESESEDEVETEKANGLKTTEEDESSDESESDESASEDEAPKARDSAPKATQASAEASDSDESDDSSSSEDGDDSADEAVEASKAGAAESDDESTDESESDEEEKAAPKTNGVPATTPTNKDTTSDEEESNEDDDEDEDEDDDDDSSDDASESDGSHDSEESEVKADTKQTKRKAEDDTVPAAKKSKVEEVATSPNLFIGNLSWNVDEEWLRQEFEEFGELKGVRLMTDRQTGRSKGFGYVEFVNAADAAKAHSAKQGAELDGRAMNVDFANARPNNTERQENRRKSYGDQTSEPTNTLFLGNLSFDVTQDDVSEAFGPHGTIIGVRLPTDRETGAPKGFGYVTFATIEEATAALEAMQGGYIKNRSLRLDYSQPRQQNGDSPARGGFGGRGGRGGFGGRGRGGRGDFGARGGRGGGRGGRPMTTNRGGFGDFTGKKTTF